MFRSRKRGSGNAASNTGAARAPVQARLFCLFDGGLGVVARETRVALVGKHVLAGFLAPGNEAYTAVLEDGRILEFLRGEQFPAVWTQLETLVDPSGQ